MYSICRRHPLSYVVQCLFGYFHYTTQRRGCLSFCAKSRTCSFIVWEDISNNGSAMKLSSIINRYKTNLANYILDANMREYFTNLFDNYNTSVNPLNWVVHRPEEYQLPAKDLIELPRKGLLALINFLIS